MLNPTLDIEALRREFAKDGRVRVPDVLQADVAARVMDACREPAYDYILFSGNQNRVVSEAEMAALSPEQRRQLQAELNELASRGIGFLYGGLRMEGDRLARAPTILRQLFLFVNDSGMLEFARRVSGMDDLDSASGQYTRYTPGNYLTRHSDHVIAERRRLAYVLNLTPHWHPDWGGLLQFYQDDGTPRDAWEPRPNSLTLFDVRHVHSVTYVAPFATAPRYALTGWFRGG